MSTDARVRKAWLLWLKELEHSEIEWMMDRAWRNIARTAFEAGYRARRRNNDCDKKPVNKS